MPTRSNQPPINHQPEPPVYNAVPNLSPVTRPDSPGHLNPALDHPHSHHSNPALQSESKNGEAATSWSKVVSTGFEVVSSGADEEQRSSGGTPTVQVPVQQNLRNNDPDRGFNQNMDNKGGRRHRHDRDRNDNKHERNNRRRNADWEDRRRDGRRPDNRDQHRKGNRNNGRYSDHRGDPAHRVHDSERRGGYPNGRQRQVDPEKEFFIRNVPVGLESLQVEQAVSNFGKVSKVDIRDRKMDNNSNDRPSRYGFLTFSEVDTEGLLASSPFTVDNRAFSVERHKQPPHGHHRGSGNFRGRRNGRGNRNNNRAKYQNKHDESPGS